MANQLTPKKPATTLSARLRDPVVIIAAAAATSLLFIVWLFVPGGLLDSLTSQETEVAADLTPEKNAAFLAENAKKSGVKVTSSGLQYRQLSPGKGAQPGPRSQVTVHYVGALINGKQFDSSEGGAPITFGLNQVIPGWTEGLQLMHEGEKAELVIPQDLGYGARGAGGSIPPYQTLVFQVELIKVQ
jgi:FKBP-type peptidyl-prolyl cis-trans isomerase